MHYVYILRSLKYADQYYIGKTSDPRHRLREHNNGKCPTTADAGPWKFKNCFYFEESEKASSFERYLKSHSGRSFEKRHF